jgi:hypothetical protein
MQLERIRARVARGDASRAEAISDARALLAMLDRLAAETSPEAWRGNADQRGLELSA